MKKYIFAIALVLLTLTGCGKSQTQPKDAVCFALAGTANSQGLNLGTPLVQEQTLETIRGYGYLSVVSIDGQPEILCAQSYDLDAKYKKASETKLESDAKANAAGFLTDLSQVTANDPEVDFLAGLQLAARSLRSLEGYDRKTIVVVGTGLSTAGVLDFRNNLLSAQPEEVVSQLAERNEIPNLSGITVIWQQMGDVAAPQQALTQAQRIKLQSIWQGIVEQGGGCFQTTDIMAAPVADRAYPTVSTVTLPALEPLRWEPEQPITAQVLADPIVLSEEQVTFVGDQAVYLHPEEAKETIAPIAAFLTENPGIRILLVGTTAGDATNEYTLTLSSARANAVKDTLTEMGIAGERILTLGLGSSDPWHITGASPTSPLSAANRKVVLMDADSDAAVRLMQGV